jgi:hypothetical protein
MNTTRPVIRVVMTSSQERTGFLNRSEAEVLRGRFYLSVYGGLGGVKINHRAEVMTKDFEVIRGSTAEGMTQFHMQRTYPFYLCGHTSGFCL